MNGCAEIAVHFIFLRNRKLSDPPPYLTPAAEDTKDLINMAARTGKLQVRAESAAVKKTNKKRDV